MDELMDIIIKQEKADIDENSSSVLNCGEVLFQRSTWQVSFNCICCQIKSESVCAFLMHILRDHLGAPEKKLQHFLREVYKREKKLILQNELFRPKYKSEEYKKDELADADKVNSGVEQKTFTNFESLTRNELSEVQLRSSSKESLTRNELSELQLRSSSKKCSNINFFDNKDRDKTSRKHKNESFTCKKELLGISDVNILQHINLPKNDDEAKEEYNHFETEGSSNISKLNLNTNSNNGEEDYEYNDSFNMLDELDNDAEDGQLSNNQVNRNACCTFEPDQMQWKESDANICSSTKLNEEDCDLNSQNNIINAEYQSEESSEFQTYDLKIELLSDIEDSSKSNEMVSIKPTPKRRNYLKCKFCAEKGESDLALCPHKRKHPRPHACEFCSATFADTSNLKVHRNRHLGIKPHHCTMCEKSFISTSELKLHIRSHTGERPYICEECGRGFTNSTHLNSHMRRHTNVRPYVCQTCKKSFYDSKLLREHEASHSTERPFSCDQCFASFTRRKSLKEHEKIHSKIKNYVCRICSKAFAQYAGLHNHIKTNHGAH